MRSAISIDHPRIVKILRREEGMQEVKIPESREEKAIAKIGNASPQGRAIMRAD
jgi:hypothetical protein